MYVVYFCETMRDGKDHGAKIIETLEKALKYINDGRWYPRSNYAFKLFELGEEIPLVTKTIETKKEIVETRTVVEVNPDVLAQLR